MGRLENGVWVYDEGIPNLAAKEDKFEKVITRDGSSGHPAVAGRYHLYVCLSCPFAHRVLIIRKLKHLEDAISVSIVDPRKGDEGWEFSDYPGSVPDAVCGFKNLREHYLQTKPDFTGRVVVPTLWDKETGEVLNNSSEQMVVMLNNEFDGPVEFELVHNRFNEGRFSLAILTNESDLAAAFYQQFDIFQNGFIAVFFGHMFRFDHYFSGYFRNWEGDIHNRIVIFIYFNSFYFIQLLDK